MEYVYKNIHTYTHEYIKHNSTNQTSSYICPGMNTGWDG